MKRLHDLGVRAWPGAAGTVTFPLQSIPTEYGKDSLAVAHMIVSIEMDITTGAGGGCTGREILEFFQTLVLKSNLHTWMPGIDLFQYVTLLLEGGFHTPGVLMPAAIIANQANVIRRLNIPIDFERLEMEDGSQYAVPPEYFDAGQFNVRMAAAINANTAVNACAISLHVNMIRRSTLKLPPLWVVNANNGAALFDRLPAGVYTELMIVPPTGGFALVTDITNVVMKAGGEVFHNSVGPDAVIGAYLADIGPAAANLGGLDWNNDFAAIEYFPIIWGAFDPEENKASDLVDTMGSSLNMDCDGGLATPVWCYRYYQANDDTMQSNGVRALGARPEETNVEAPSLNGGAVSKEARQVRPGLKILPTEVKGFSSPQGAGALSGRFSATKLQLPRGRS